MDLEDNHGQHKYRGKLYVLNDESLWQDTGTGYISLTGPEDARRLVFRGEEESVIIHDRPVFERDRYQLQGAEERQTIIAWEDPETQKDWALSFQDSDGTSEIFELIATNGSSSQLPRWLPIPSLSTLPELSKRLMCVPPSQREAFASDCMTAKFLAGLRECFHTAEDLGSEDVLGMIWYVIKGCFLLSNQKLTERLLRTDTYEDVMGMLEYDDGLCEDKRISHRQILAKKVQFREAVAFEDRSTLDRIHLNFRLQYMKDVVLPRILDDGAFVSLTQMIHGNLAVILRHLQTNTVLLERLFAQLKELDLQSLMFVQDACRLMRQIPPSDRQALYEKMVGLDLFRLLMPFLEDCTDPQSPLTHDSALALGKPSWLPEAVRPRHLAVEVLFLASFYDASHLRRFIVCPSVEGEAQGRQMLKALARLLLYEDDQGVQSQIADILKALLDPSVLEPIELEKCFEVFYDQGGLDDLVAAFIDWQSCLNECVSVSFGRQLACEVFAYAVVHHGYRAKAYILRHGVAQHAVRLMLSPHRFLHLAPIRLLRAIVRTKDEQYLRYLSKYQLFAPAMRCFKQCHVPPAWGGNLLVSATLELLEFIRLENIKILVSYLCTKHLAVIEEFRARYKTLDGLLTRHQQNLEYDAFPPEQHAAGGPMHAGGPLRSRRRSPGRGEDSDDDDESYFESLDEDDAVAPVPGVAPPGPGDGAGAGIPRGSAIEASDAVGKDSVSDSGGRNTLQGLLGSYDDENESEVVRESKDASVVADVGVLPAKVREVLAAAIVQPIDSGENTLSVESVLENSSPPKARTEQDENSTAHASKRLKTCISA